MQRYQHKDRFPEVQWNRSGPITEEELIALASKCLLINPDFQLQTFFNEDSWYYVGESAKRKAGLEVSQIKEWKGSDFQVFMNVNRCSETNRKIQVFIQWLKDRQGIHPKDFNPNQPNYVVAEQYIDTLLDAIENPSELASKIFGSCDVFISHSTGDTHAGDLTQALESRGLNVYMTPELDLIEQGANWPEDIIKHLKGARIIVIVLTDESKKSPAVNQEIGFAIGFGKRRLVWFSGNSSSYILLPGDIQECSMSQWDAEKVGKHIYEVLNR